jgi:hypothetical protein
MPPRALAAIKNHTATLGLDAKLWLASDKLRNNRPQASAR